MKSSPVSIEAPDTPIGTELAHFVLLETGFAYATWDVPGGRLVPYPEIRDGPEWAADLEAAGALNRPVIVAARAALASRRAGS